jgi:hypothetical protein
MARALDLRRPPGVQPTNNHAERALRSAVIYRKLSLGSQSHGGERQIERLLSAHTTCRLQHRSLYVYLTNTITAHARGTPSPCSPEHPNPLNAYTFFYIRTVGQMGCPTAENCGVSVRVRVSPFLGKKAALIEPSLTGVVRS